MSALRVAALQMRSGTTVDVNLNALEALVAEAAEAGAVYALSPEVTVVFAENREGLSRVAGPYENNAALQRVAGMARAHRISLHLGSLAVALPDGRFANRSVVFGPDVIASLQKSDPRPRP
jgi:predicted amidohydrolase